MIRGDSGSTTESFFRIYKTWLVRSTRFMRASSKEDDFIRLPKGDMRLKSITVEAKTENAAVVTDFVNDILEENGCPMKVQMKIDIAIDEVFSNIAYYAYASGSGVATVQVEIEEAPKRLELIFIDSGIPYNPLEKKDPDVTLDAEERKIGGLGIYLVKEMMDEVLYEHTDGQNILKLKKDL